MVNSLRLTENNLTQWLRICPYLSISSGRAPLPLLVRGVKCSYSLRKVDRIQRTLQANPRLFKTFHSLKITFICPMTLLNTEKTKEQ